MKSKTCIAQISIPLVISMSEEYQLYFFHLRKIMVALLYQVIFNALAFQCMHKQFIVYTNYTYITND